MAEFFPTQLEVTRRAHIDWLVDESTKKQDAESRHFMRVEAIVPYGGFKRVERAAVRPAWSDRTRLLRAFLTVAAGCTSTDGTYISKIKDLRNDLNTLMEEMEFDKSKVIDELIYALQFCAAKPHFATVVIMQLNYLKDAGISPTTKCEEVVSQIIIFATSNWYIY